MADTNRNLSKLPVAEYGTKQIVSHDSDGARDLYVRSSFGEMKTGGHVVFMPLEALYLVQKERLAVVDSKGKPITFKKLFSLVSKSDKMLVARFAVYSDFRERGYIIKTALKFGADFRVYDRGVKPGADHAKWIVYPVNESDKMSWYDFCSKNRVAHSTKKKLMMAVVDDEGDVTYFEINWARP